MNGKTQTALKDMDEAYWDRIATDYDGEIFSALANDRQDLIASKICQFSDSKAFACDFGCGVGKFLPILAENFRHVFALDISKELLNQACDSCRQFDNITFCKKDLSKAALKLQAVDFALSVNVAIMPSQQTRTAIFRTISRHLCSNRHLLLVVPSLESALYADYRLIQWNLKAGLKGAKVLSELKNTQAVGNISLRQGLIDINSVPTKHYLSEELEAMFKDLPLNVLSIEKVQYPWDTEFDSPPTWMKEPYPWDWMVLLKKTTS